jgi:uncharacterized protein (DUF58 family)
MATHLLKPEVLQGLANLDLIARSAIEGFLIGSHKSVHHGFSQEFAEYRAYREGDDLRFVDWNVFARTNKTYLKQYQGETNTHLTILMDASASMGFTSGKVTKYEYGSYLAASMAYLSKRQQDAIGLMIFNDKVVDFRPPTSRSEALPSLLHALEQSVPGQGTDFGNPVRDCCELIQRAGIIAVISDFLDHPEQILDELQPLRGRGQDVILFQILDPQELNLKLDRAVQFEDMESGKTVNVDPTFARKEYSERIQEHIAEIKEVANSTAADHMVITTDEPLDVALRNYLLHRQRRG